MQCPLDLLSKSVPAKRERRKEARPGELLAAALSLFVEKGFAATRAEEVAKRAGVSKGTLFLYFSSKEDLFKAVVRESISGRFHEWASERNDYQGSSADLLRDCLTTWWERIGSTQAAGITKLIITEAANFPELAAFYQSEVVVPGTALIQRVLQRGIESGEFRPVDLQYGSFLVMAPMLWLAISSHSVGACIPSSMEFDPQEYIKLQIDNLLQGLVIRPSAATPPRTAQERALCGPA